MVVQTAALTAVATVGLSADDSVARTEHRWVVTLADKMESKLAVKMDDWKVGYWAPLMAEMMVAMMVE